MRQLNLLAAYAYFFNPLRFLAALVFSKSKIPLVDAETWPPPATVRSGVHRTKLTRRLKRQVWGAPRRRRSAAIWHVGTDGHGAADHRLDIAPCSRKDQTAH